MANTQLRIQQLRELHSNICMYNEGRHTQKINVLSGWTTKKKILFVSPKEKIIKVGAWEIGSRGGGVSRTLVVLHKKYVCLP